MSNYNGKGPAGAGATTGRGMGPCGSARALGAGNGRGYAHGRGMGMSHGFGRGLAWMALGYGREGDASPAANIRSALEERKAFLRAELARTESLLGEDARGTAASTDGDEAK
jgi:hypothetical protein